MDPAIHNSNTGVFRGRRLRVPEADQIIRDDVVLDAIRRFMIETGSRPTANSWSDAGMVPSEKTVRRRFGSFKAAIALAQVR